MKFSRFKIKNIRKNNFNLETIKKKIGEILKKTDFYKDYFGTQPSVSSCVSEELNGSKGGLIVFAGTFNGSSPEEVFIFARELSKELQCKVICMFYDDNVEQAENQVYYEGKVIMMKGCANVYEGDE